MRLRSGWGLLLVFVVAYDTWALLGKHQTLSAEFLDAVQHPKRRWFVIAAWAYLTAHLFGLLPRKYDPLIVTGSSLARK